jgi:hypothetical protein
MMYCYLNIFSKHSGCLLQRTADAFSQSKESAARKEMGHCMSWTLHTIRAILFVIGYPIGFD